MGERGGLRLQRRPEAGVAIEPRVTYQIVRPAKIKDPKLAIVGISGAFIQGQSSLPLWQAYADKAGCNVYAMDAKLPCKPEEEAHLKGSLLAKSFPTLDETKGIERVIIVGHSEGGNEGISMAVAFDPKFEVVGGIFFSPPFSYQLPSQLVGRAVVDVLKTGRDMFRHPLRHLHDVPAVTDYFGESTNGMVHSNIRNTIRACGPVNPDLRGYDKPAVIILGKEDPMSTLEDLIPHPRWRGRDDTREKYMQECYFRSKAPVKVIEVPGGHHNWPLVNPEEAAQLGLETLEELLTRVN